MKQKIIHPPTVAVQEIDISTFKKMDAAAPGAKHYNEALQELRSNPGLLLEEYYSLSCPITQLPFNTPVIVKVQHQSGSETEEIYEQEALDIWLNINKKNCSPLSNGTIIGDKHSKLPILQELKDLITALKPKPTPETLSAKNLQRLKDLHTQQTSNSTQMHQRPALGRDQDLQKYIANLKLLQSPQKQGRTQAEKATKKFIAGTLQQSGLHTITLAHIALIEDTIKAGASIDLLFEHTPKKSDKTLRAKATYPAGTILSYMNLGEHKRYHKSTNTTIQAANLEMLEHEMTCRSLLDQLKAQDRTNIDTYLSNLWKRIADNEANQSATRDASKKLRKRKKIHEDTLRAATDNKNNSPETMQYMQEMFEYHANKLLQFFSMVNIVQKPDENKTKYRLLQITAACEILNTLSHILQQRTYNQEEHTENQEEHIKKQEDILKKIKSIKGYMSPEENKAKQYAAKQIRERIKKANKARNLDEATHQLEQSIQRYDSFAPTNSPDRLFSGNAKNKKSTLISLKNKVTKQLEDKNKGNKFLELLETIKLLKEIKQQAQIKCGNFSHKLSEEIEKDVSNLYDFILSGAHKENINSAIQAVLDEHNDSIDSATRGKLQNLQDKTTFLWSYEQDKNIKLLLELSESPLLQSYNTSGKHPSPAMARR